MTTVSVPSIEFALQPGAVDVFQSCSYFSPNIIDPPDPSGPPEAPVDNGIWVQVVPDISYEDLPDAPEIIDTSPAQMIGCIGDTGGNAQARLSSLFPDAEPGDGVIERTTNHIWVFDGSSWENVGSTPGPTIVATQVVPPWNEILLANAVTRTKLALRPFPYLLQLLTDVGGVTSLTGLGFVAARLVKIQSSANYSLSSNATLSFDPSTVPFVAEPYLYKGNASTQTISGLLWDPGLVWIKSLSQTYDHDIVDFVRGSNLSIRPNLLASEQNRSNNVTSLGAKSFTLGSYFRVNANNVDYVAWAFKKPNNPSSNTGGSIATQVAADSNYSIITYTGNGVAGASIGHGLASAPAFVIIKRRNGSDAFIAGGPAVGDNNYLTLNTSNDRISNTAYIRTTDSAKITIGNSGSVNGSSSTYVAYAFREVPKQSKISTYSGNGSLSGQFINCGFPVRFLLVKAITGSGNAGSWHILDWKRGNGNSYLRVNANTQQQQLTDAFYAFEGNGFRALRGNQSAAVDINASGVTYMYVAFGAYTPTLVVPKAVIDITASSPRITRATGIHVPTISIDMEAVLPDSIG